MDVLVCVKRVPGPGSTIPLTEAADMVDTRNLGFTVGPHEECAIEEAVQIAAEHSGTVTVLTVGPPAAEEQLRAALSVGADHGVLVETGPGDCDPQATAVHIVHAIQTLSAEGHQYDLVLFGNESADAGHYQVAVRVAHALGLPFVGGIKGVELGSGDRPVAWLRREMPDGIDVYEVTLPTAVAVKEGLNLPRYPSMRGRLRASRASLRTIEAEGVSGGLRTVGLRYPPETESGSVRLGDGPEAAGAVVDVFEELGVM